MLGLRLKNGYSNLLPNAVPPAFWGIYCAKTGILFRTYRFFTRQSRIFLHALAGKKKNFTFVVHPDSRT
jgi:hypothetical protein